MFFLVSGHAHTYIPYWLYTVVYIYCVPICIVYIVAVVALCIVQK